MRAELVGDFQRLIYGSISETDVECETRDVLSVYTECTMGAILDHVSKLRRSAQKLTETIRRMDRILMHLFEKKAISQRHYDVIRSKLTVHEQTISLVDVLRAKPANAYVCFLDALRSTGQQHLCDLLEHYGTCRLISRLHCAKYKLWHTD